MTALQARIFIAIDEWLGAGVLLYLKAVHDPSFRVVLVFWIVATYVVAYPSYWWRFDRWWKGRAG